LSGERPYTIFKRSDKVAVFVTREQRGTPHLLVVTIRHTPTILDLTDEELKLLAVETREMASVIDRTYARPGIAVWQNNGIPAGQVIDHFHFHVAGTLDSGGTNFGKVEELTVAETNEIAKRLSGTT
jgi:histidine triad (HIT) family protein